MKIAILGAGLSGLSCAIKLKQYGFKPTVFENRERVGDRFINGEIMLEILYRPITDSLAYLSETTGIYLQPLSNIKQLVLFSQNHRAEITGHLGYVTARGRHNHSLESQLFNQYSEKIHFNSQKSYEEIIKEYTHVVLATGDALYASKLQNYQRSLGVKLFGAIINGKFDPHTVYAWLDYNLAPRGYCYLIPLSHDKANAVVAYPNYPESDAYNPPSLWNKFLERLSQDVTNSFEVTGENFNVNNYLIGISPNPRIGNTFLSVIAFAHLCPFWGLGSFLQYCPVSMLPVILSERVII